MSQSEEEGKPEVATDQIRKELSERFATLALIHHLAYELFRAPPALHWSFVNVFGTGLVPGIRRAVALGWVEQLDRAQGQNWVRLSRAGLYVAESSTPFLEKP